MGLFGPMDTSGSPFQNPFAQQLLERLYGAQQDRPMSEALPEEMRRTVRPRALGAPPFALPPASRAASGGATRPNAALPPPNEDSGASQPPVYQAPKPMRLRTKIFRDIGAGLLGTAAGMFNPEAGADIASRVSQFGPERAAQRQYQSNLQDWMMRQAIARQKNLDQQGASTAAAQQARDRAEADANEALASQRRNPPAKEGNPEQQAYDSYLAQGMTPADAYRKVLDDAQSAKPTKPEGAPTTKTMMVRGKPMVMGWNPATNKFDIPEGEAQPNYGQEVLPTKTIQALVNGIPTTMGWDPQTQSYSIPQGRSATGAYAHEEAQAGAVQRAGEQLITQLQANRANLGTLSAWVNKYGLNTPIADPKLAELQSELSTFAALQPAMHGFRSHSALETFNKIIGGLQKNPDATIASIRGILTTAGAINPGRQSAPGGEQNKIPSFSEWKQQRQ